MDYQKLILSNGLRLITVPMPQVQSVTVEIFVGAGSRHEEKPINGLAHFLEHMVFKGTKRYPSAKIISTTLDKVGAEANANTGKERTAFHVRVMESHINLAFDILSSLIWEPLLQIKEINKERGVILEEIAMYEDIPMRRAPEIFEQLLYGDTPLAWDIAGTKETVRNIKQEDFIKFRKTLYHPKNMVLVVAGKFDSQEVKNLAEKRFALPQNLTTRSTDNLISDDRYPRPDHSKVNPSHSPALLLYPKKTEQAHIVLGVRGNPLGHQDRYAEGLLATILGGGMSSRLFTEIREKRGLAYYVRTEIGHYKQAGDLSTSAGVKLDKVGEAINLIVEEYSKIATTKAPVSGKELRKAKEQLKGHLALSLESTENVADLFGEQELLEEKIKTPKDLMEEVEKVTPEDVKRVAAQFFKNERLNLVILGPYEDPAPFRKILKI